MVSLAMPLVGRHQVRYLDGGEVQAAETRAVQDDGQRASAALLRRGAQHGVANQPHGGEEEPHVGSHHHVLAPAGLQGNESAAAKGWAGES